MNRAKRPILPLIAIVALAACGGDDVADSTPAAETTPEAESAPVVKTARNSDAVTPKVAPGYDGTIGKPGAPFRVSYDVVGTPIVGSPVTVNLRVSSALGARPVTVSYRINDASAMMFHDAQPKQVELAPAANQDFVTQQVTVIPQREGRLYLNVATAVETDDGSRSSVVAIPIQVGGGARRIEEQGEVQLDEDGEAIRVLENP